MTDLASSIRAQARDRGTPSLAEAVSATGGIAIALGVLLLTIDVWANHAGRAAEAAMFAALVVGGYVALLFLPRETHAAGVSAIVLGIPGVLGWLILPGASRFADIRPFLILTIAAWVVAFLAPRTGGRTIFVAAAALLLWLWILGEVAGTDAYSANPLPSPPAHTLFSLQAFSGARSMIELGDLDSSDPLYPVAQQCEADATACDDLSRQADFGSDLWLFGATCGNRKPDTSAVGRCTESQLDPFQAPSQSGIRPISPLTNATNGKAFEIGMVSVLFGLAYLGALFMLHRARWRGLATAFVFPAFATLVTGTQSLGEAAHHAWVGGLLAIAAGLAFGVVGDRTRRRFTAWAGAITVAYGAIVIALDVSHVLRGTNGGNVRLARPGFTIIGFGAGLIALAVLVAELLRRSPGAPDEPEPVAVSTGRPPFDEPPAWPTPPTSPPPAPPTDPPAPWPPHA